MKRKDATLIFLAIAAIALLALSIFGQSGLINSRKSAKAAENIEKKLELDNIDILVENHDASRMQTLEPFERSGTEIMNKMPLIARVALDILAAVVLLVPVIMILKKKRIADNSADELDNMDNISVSGNGKLINMADRNGINDMIDILQTGGIAIMPCDTIYGICSMVNRENKLRIEKIKQRDSKKNFIILCTKDRARILLGPNCPEEVYNIWPAPLTVIAKNKTGDSVAVRVPKDPRLYRILFATGGIYSTSVNFSGEKEMSSVSQMAREFGSLVDAIGYDNSYEPDSPSTILDITSHPYRIVREGAVSRAQLKKYLPSQF